MFSEMTEFINNNESPNLDLVDNSNNCVDSCKERPRDQSNGQESDVTEEEQEEEYTIRIPFFTLDQYKKGLLSKFDEIIGTIIWMILHWE